FKLISGAVQILPWIFFVSSPPRPISRFVSSSCPANGHDSSGACLLCETLADRLFNAILHVRQFTQLDGLVCYALASLCDFRCALIAVSAGIKAVGYSGKQMAMAVD